MLIGNLSSVSIADLSTELCVAEPVMWNAVCPTWTLFIGGKKIYILCWKNISNTDIFRVLAGSGGGERERERERPVKKKQYRKNICLHDFHSVVRPFIFWVGLLPSSTRELYLEKWHLVSLMTYLHLVNSVGKHFSYLVA